MRSRIPFRIMLLLAALLILLTGCNTPATPTEPTADTTPTVDMGAQLIAENPKAVEELTDTDHAVLLHPNSSNAAADTFAAHVGADGVLVSGVERFSCQDLTEQKIRILSVDQNHLDQAQVTAILDALAATPEGYGVILVCDRPEGLAEVPYAGTILSDIVDAFCAEVPFSCRYGDITVDADFSNLPRNTEFLAYLTHSFSDTPASWLPGTAAKQLVLAAPQEENAIHGYIFNRKKDTVRILGVGVELDETVDQSAPFEETEIPFSTEFLTQMELDAQWTLSEDGLRFTSAKAYPLPYEETTLLVKVNAPFAVEILSGTSPDNLSLLPGSFSNLEEGIYACLIPQEHTYFGISLTNGQSPVSTLELELADVQIWYDPCAHQWLTMEVPSACDQWGISVGVCTICGREDTGTIVTDITDRFVFTQSMTVNIVNGKISADDKWALSDPVNIAGYDSLEVTISNDNSTATASGLCFFNAEGRRVAGGILNADGTGKYGVSIRTVEIPETAVYVRTIWFADSNTGYDSSWGNFYCKATGPKSAVPPTGHSYESVVTPPGCKQRGFTTHTCTVCGDSFTDSELPMAHSYRSGVCTECGDSVLGVDWVAPEFPEGDYTFAVLPDTQSLVEHWPHLFSQLTQWLADNQERLNIEAVFHLGDMVDDNLDIQWKNVKAGMDILDSAGIPWMPMRGNHDHSDYFNRYFDYAAYGTNRSWFGGTYEEGTLDYTYWFVSAGNREYLILSLGWAPTWDVLDWAKGIVEAHPDKNVILTLHGFMNTNGQHLSEVSSISITKYFKDRPEGYQVWEAFAGYENVVLAMGGHVPSPDIITRTDKNGAGKNVTSLLLDRQHDDVTDRLGTIAFFIFSEETDTVEVRWYSQRYDAFFREKNQFSIEVPHITE